MAEYQMTLVDRERIANDTMAFWFHKTGPNFEFRAGQHSDFALCVRIWELRASILGPFRSQALQVTKAQSAMNGQYTWLT